jgi:CRP-like cAMP-binding protein
MAMRGLDVLLAEVPLLAGMRPDDVELLAGCASNVHFSAGDMLFREGDEADAFYVIRGGTVALETFVPARGSMHFDARALSELRATVIDGACLRGKCEADPALGYDLMKRFAQVMIERLQWTRLRLLDVYGRGDS